MEKPVRVFVRYSRRYHPVVKGCLDSEQGTRAVRTRAPRESKTDHNFPCPDIGKSASLSAFTRHVDRRTIVEACKDS